MNALPKRQTPAKGVHVKPDQPTILWGTVCSKDRSEWLIQEPVMRTLHSIWLNEGLRDSRVIVERWVAFWKRGTFHHRVRSVQEYREKWTYMMENPVRKGLVTQWEDWPWRGQVHDLSW